MGRRPRRKSERRGGPVAASLHVVAVGRARGPERALFERYATRLRPALLLTEVPDGTGAPVEIRRREAAHILGVLPTAPLLVVLDQDGRAMSSVILAETLSTWLEAGRETVFVIGGAEGLDRSLLDRAAVTLSLGSMTWPHQLARIMLAEQLYRARTILDRHPYHRAGRPA